MFGLWSLELCWSGSHGVSLAMQRIKTGFLVGGRFRGAIE